MDVGGRGPLETVEGFRAGRAWNEIELEFSRTGRAAGVQSGLTAVAEAIVGRVYRERIEPALPSSAVLAVGEFGRRELAPYSVVEIAVLFESEPSRAAREALSGFARLLSEAGIAANCSTCSIAGRLEYGEEDAGLAIGLLDQRLVAGDAGVHAQFVSRFAGFLARHGRKLCERMGELARARHGKFARTIRHLEPDIVEAPGGLRDLHLVNCLARLRPDDAPDGSDLGEAGAFLSAARCFLHYRASGDRNILRADAQESVVRQPYAGSATPAEWMRAYYGYARAVYNEARRALETSERQGTSLLDRFRDRRSQLSNADFTVLRERLYVRNPPQLETDPAMLTRLVEFVSRHGIPLATETERRLLSARRALFAGHAQSPPAWTDVKTFLSGPHAALALRVLDDAGLMPAVFPEWTEIADLAVMDAESRYTVDERALAAVERVAELRAAADPARRRFAELLSEIDSPALLLFALLYRGMGKRAGAADSPSRAAALALQAGERMRMPEEERSAVAFLVERQRDLFEATSGRDLDDPATARMLAERVGTVERLKLLAALAYGDLATADAGAATAWRLDQLWRSYAATRSELTRELETGRILELPDDLAGGADFVKGFPVRYLRSRPHEMGAHIRLYEQSRPTGAAAGLERIEGAWKLTVVARDMPGLFASLAGAISSFGLDIIKAEAFANAKGIILDTFVFIDLRRMLELNPQEIERLQDLIRRVALGRTDVRRLLRDRALPDPKKRPAPPQVRFDSEACETATLVEIVAEDRPGLLYSLASVFSSSGCNIDVVLIDTKGRRAIDVFYVAYEGGKLAPDMQDRLEEKLVAAC